MRTKATSLSIHSEKISAFKFALEYQEIDSYKRLELQTKDAVQVVKLFIQFRGFVHSVSRSFVFAGEHSADRLHFWFVQLFLRLPSSSCYS